LAEVEEEATFDELHDDVDEVLNYAARRLVDLACITVLVHADDSLMLKVLEDSNFVVNRDDRVLVAAKELFFKDLDCSELFGANKLTKVNFTSVALAEGLDDLILLVEDRMSLCSWGV